MSCRPSRRIVGWTFGETMTSELVLAALNMALELRKPEGAVHHGNRRCVADRHVHPNGMGHSEKREA